MFKVNNKDIVIVTHSFSLPGYLNVHVLFFALHIKHIEIDEFLVELMNRLFYNTTH